MLPMVCVNDITRVNRLTHKVKTSYRRDYTAHALTIKKYGSTVYETPAGEYLTDSTHMLLIRKGVSCVINPEVGECITIGFEASFSESLPDITSFEIKNNYSTMDILERMVESWSTNTLSHRYICMSGFYKILSLLEQDNYAVDTVGNCPQIQPALDLIERNYGDPDLGNDDLAKCVNLSVSHFRKLFRNTLRKSPIQYLRTIRINKAKELLAAEGKAVTETSEIVGFSNPFYFDVVFKKETGMTPTDFIRNVRSGKG